MGLSHTLACGGCRGVEVDREDPRKIEPLVPPPDQRTTLAIVTRLIDQYGLRPDIENVRGTLEKGRLVPVDWSTEKMREKHGITGNGFVLVEQSYPTGVERPLDPRNDPKVLPITTTARYFEGARGATVAFVTKLATTDRGDLRHPETLEELTADGALNGGRKEAFLYRSPDRCLMVVSSSIGPEDLSELIDEMSPLERQNRFANRLLARQTGDAASAT